MARKSRKNPIQTEQQIESICLPFVESVEKIPTAIYGRLSVEDDDSNESMETQIALVQDFINKSSELECVDTYFDNGFTGTNFKRPAFTRLMNDVRQKKIQCIVVKDLSRFGRNYLEAGYYIETVFPFLGVRLIAVTDNFDSNREEDMNSIVLPIRNMVNAMYAKDISKKIWTSLQRKKEAGFTAGNNPPFGYIRNPDTMRNEIDPEAAFYVQLIFQWKLMGVSIGEICQRLTIMRVPTPREWHRQQADEERTVTYKKWGVTSVHNMLINQTYVGDTVTNKSSQKLFAGQAKQQLSNDQWLITQNTHPAIIARDDFERVQEMLAESAASCVSARAASKGIRETYKNELAGMVFCADCGRPMEYDRLPHGVEERKKICYYICKARRAYDKCIGHQISEVLLKSVLMEQIHHCLEVLCDKSRLAEELKESQSSQNPIFRAKGEIISLKDKINVVMEKREKLYADFVAGVVDMEDYQMIKEDYARQQESLKDELKKAEQKKSDIENQMDEFIKMTKNLEGHLNDREFDIELVKALIQKIEVGADKRIRLTYRFKDVFGDGMAGEEK